MWCHDAGMDAMPFNSFIDGSENDNDNDNDTGLLQKAEGHSRKQVKQSGKIKAMNGFYTCHRVFNQGQVSDGVLFCEFCEARIF